MTHEGLVNLKETFALGPWAVSHPMPALVGVFGQLIPCLSMSRPFLFLQTRSRALPYTLLCFACAFLS